MRVFILVTIAGGVGSAVRFATASWLNRVSVGVFPLGTFTVNIVGALLIGAVSELAVEGRVLSREAAIIIATGFLGGLTTFSSYALEGERMLERRELVTMATYLLGSLVLGIAAVWMGGVLARWIAAE